jgi:hypothetical protein
MPAPPECSFPPLLEVRVTVRSSFFIFDEELRFNLAQNGRQKQTKNGEGLSPLSLYSPLVGKAHCTAPSAPRNVCTPVGGIKGRDRKKGRDRAKPPPSKLLERLFPSIAQTQMHTKHSSYSDPIQALLDRIAFCSPLAGQRIKL